MSTDENKILSRCFLEDLWNAKNLAALDEILTADFVEHIGEASLNVEGIKQMLSANFAAFPDMQATIEDQIAEGDMVVTRWTARGTHKGELMGIPPSGKAVTVTAIVIDRIVGGKIAETWTSYDALGLLQQIGAAPVMG
jgi:steroid delta-isomerase-like uncharacterized protein